MKPPTPEKQLAEFIGKFTPEMAARIRTARAKMRKCVPQALDLVYDNYNFFVIGYLKRGSHLSNSPWHGELEAAKKVARQGLRAAQRR